MPRPVSQYFSLPFNRHCIRSPPRCLPELCRMPAAIRRRPEERKARAGRHSHPAQLRSRPPRAPTSIPRVGTQAFGSARLPVSNSDTLLMRLSAGRPAGWSAGPGGVESQAMEIRPAESRISSRCTLAANQPYPLRPRSAPHCSAPPRILPVGKIFCVEGGDAVLNAPAKTFLTGGRVCKDLCATHNASHACAQSWRRFAFQRRFFSVRFCHNSRAVLRLWQE